ncbi:MAG: hypothetical protein ACD_24C00432G0001, partial [uncultured bacterium]
MKPKFSLPERERILRRIIINHESISKIAQELDISRTLIYRWLKRYQITACVIPQKGTISSKPHYPIQIRIQAINEVLNKHKSVSDVCRQFNISRPIFYRWLKRYKEVGYTDPRLRKDDTSGKAKEIPGQAGDDKFVFNEHKALAALEDKKPHTDRYPNQISQEYDDLILDAVVHYPEMSSHKLVHVLPAVGGRPVVGHHGVQNVLRRHNLNTYEKRLAFAQSRQRTHYFFIAWVKQLVFLLTAFFSLPLKTQKRSLAFISSFLIPIVTSLVIVGFIAYIRMYLESPSLVVSIGYLFASLALILGSLFFTYSLKYYATIAIVLLFSRHLSS